MPPPGVTAGTGIGGLGERPTPIAANPVPYAGPGTTRGWTRRRFGRRHGRGGPDRRHRGRHPAGVPGGPAPGGVPAARRRGGHLAGGARRRRGDGRRRRHRGHRPARGRPVRLRRLPHLRRRAARAGAGDRRGRDHPGRARGLGAAAARRAVYRAVDERAGPGAVLRPDGAQGPGRARPRRPARVRRPRLPRRRPRRARVDQRHLRRGDEDQLRAVPAALAVPLRRARRRPRPPTPRRWSSRSRARTCCSWTRRTPGWTTATRASIRAAGAAGRAVPVGRVLRPAPARRPDRPART